VPLAFILTVALAARLVFAMAVVGLDNPGKGDEADYVSIATSLANGTGFSSDGVHRTARRPPLFPFVLSLLFRAAGHATGPARVLNVLLGVLVVALLYALTSLRFGRSVAMVAAGIASIHPFLVFISAYVLTENLYIVLWLLALLAVGPPKPMPSLRRIALFAVLAALATLTRPTGLPVFAFLTAGYVLAWQPAWKRSARAVLLAVAVFAVVLAPWTLRNARGFGGWVGLTTHGGVTFYQGNNAKIIEVPQYRGGVAPLSALPHFEQIAGAGERERDRRAWKLGAEFLRTHLRELPRVAWWKFARFWRLRSDVGMAGIKSGWWFSRDSTLGDLAARIDVPMAFFAVLFPLFIAGMWFLRLHAGDAVDLYAFVLAHTAVAILFFGSLRGRIPVEPFIALFAAVAVVRGWRTLCAGRARTPRSGPARAETDTR